MAELTLFHQLSALNFKSLIKSAFHHQVFKPEPPAFQTAARLRVLLVCTCPCTRSLLAACPRMKQNFMSAQHIPQNPQRMFQPLWHETNNSWVCLRNTFLNLLQAANLLFSVDWFGPMWHIELWLQVVKGSKALWGIFGWAHDVGLSDRLCSFFSTALIVFVGICRSGGTHGPRLKQKIRLDVD